ncbi:MAG: hypothetical protein WA741_03395 [Candidatus Sulfotelmatobacter sp.]
MDVHKDQDPRDTTEQSSVEMIGTRGYWQNLQGHQPSPQKLVAINKAVLSSVCSVKGSFMA